MKRLLLLCMLFAYPALADDSAKMMPLHGQPQPNVQIINGRKFFSLGNARRFTGSLNSPKALSVIHHPRMEGTPGSRHIAPAISSGGAARAQAPASKDMTDKDKVLSIFTPDERGGSAQR